MPWVLKLRDGKYCVTKVGDSTPVPGGCHSSRADAIKHQRALYANEPSARAGSVSLMASAPLKPPREWFGLPEATAPTPLTVTADGQVYGHLALWNQCHTSFPSECLIPPRSGNGYATFHTGSLETAEGDEISVGKIVYAAKHASLESPVTAASRHYDDNGHTGAYVRAQDGRHGIWLSGALRSDLSPEGLRDMKANPPSGDWRLIRHKLELIAALAVAVPGYPVPRTHAAMAASAGEFEVDALIIGYADEEEEMSRGRSYTRRKAVIKKSMQAAAQAEKPPKYRRTSPKK